jgi:uncharacterized membrane protein YcaP (DUF421 family)
MLRRTMRQELITEEELMSQIRQQGCQSIENVEQAFIEGDGRISIITCEQESIQKGQQKERMPV